MFQILTKVPSPSVDQVPVYVGTRPLHDTCIGALPRLPTPVRVSDISVAKSKCVLEFPEQTLGLSN